MPLTPDQIAARRHLLGASEIPAVLGVDPHRSPVDVYLSKVEDLGDFTNPAIEAGNRLEPVLLAYAEEHVGRPLADRGVLHVKGLLGATLDGDFGGGEIVEAKTTGIVDDWGDEGTDQVPDRVLAQVHHQFYVTGAVVAWVPVILARFSLKFAMYRVERNNDLCEMVAAKGIEFMEQHVAKRKPPVGIPSLEILKRIRREPGTWADVPDDLVAAWIEAREAEKAAGQRRDEAQAAVLAALGSCDGGRCGQGELTYMLTQRKGYTVAASEYRTLRLKGAK